MRTHTGAVSSAAAMPSTSTGPIRLGLALVLSLGAALSLGITHFAYSLLLPPDDLGWTRVLAGAFNNSNAAGAQAKCSGQSGLTSPLARAMPVTLTSRPAPTYVLHRISPCL